MGRVRRGREHDESDKRSLELDVEEQQSLFLELDPYIYRADQVLLQTLKSFAFEQRFGSERGRIILLPPPDAVGYQVGVLSEMFDTALFASDPDGLHDEITRRFRVELIEDRIPPGRFGTFDAVVYTTYAWEALQDFTEAVLTSFTLTAPNGLAAFVLPGMLTTAGASVLWKDGTETDASQFEHGTIFRLPGVSGLEIIPFSEISMLEDDYLRRFLKRHRSYFGKAALGAALERMRDPDFTSTLTEPESSQRCAIIMYWEDAGPEESGE